MFLVLSTSGCSSLSTQPSSNETIKDIRENIARVEMEIPREYLKECEGKPQLIGTSLADIAEVVIEAEKRAQECRALHNSFVDYYKKSLLKD